MLLSLVSRLTPSRRAAPLVSRLTPSRRTAPAVAAFAACLALALPAGAEEWGFAYSGELLEMVDSQRQIAQRDGSTDYDADFYVRLYDDSDGTTSAKADALWGRLVEGVHVKNGNFAFEIKDSCGTALPARYTRLQDAFTHLSGDRLTVGVTPFDDANAEISPRQQLVTVPFVVTAGDALGTRGDAHFAGTLAAHAVKANSATFVRGATHEGDVRFVEMPTLPELTLTGDQSFAALSVETTNGFQTATLAADVVVAREAKVTVGSVGAIVATNLTVSGKIIAAALVAPPSTNLLTVAGDAEASRIEAAEIVFDGSVNLFDFDAEILTITKGSGQETWRWKASGEKGSWTLPDGDNKHNHFVSLSLCVSPNVPAVVYVGSQEVAKLAVSGVSGDVWLPFQTFLKPGETISWTSCTDDSQVLLTSRASKF